MHGETIRDAFLKMHKISKPIGSNPKIYMMYNKCSSDLKESMKKYDIDFQLSSPNMHLLNAAKQAI